MKKIYLVDSENVGDVWVPLLVSSQAEDAIIVFYTLKSPHMNYENVRLLKESEKTATFIKCFEGSNALDFQLVSELGYRMKENADASYIIVSNDTGFDAVVRYWTERQMPVSRMSGKECIRITTSKAATPASVPKKPTVEEKKVTKLEEKAEKTLPEQDKAAQQKAAESVVTEDTAEETKPQQAEDIEKMEEIIKNLCRCFSKDSLADFHNALVTLLGDAEGKALYQKMKSTPEWNAYLAEIPESNQEEKFDIYCKLVFDVSELADEYPEDFSSFLFKSNVKRKNLNSLRAALQGHYGKEKGMKYYTLIRSHIKIMNHM